MDLDQYLEKMITNTIVIWILAFEWAVIYQINERSVACETS